MGDREVQRERNKRRGRQRAFTCSTVPGAKKYNIQFTASFRDNSTVSYHQQSSLWQRRWGGGKEKQCFSDPFHKGDKKPQERGEGRKQK